MLSRFGFACAVALVLAGCVNSGRPERASDIQNLNAINDDISAVTMTHASTIRSRDPNIPSTLPRTSSTSYSP